MKEFISEILTLLAIFFLFFGSIVLLTAGMLFAFILLFPQIIENPIVFGIVLAICLYISWNIFVLVITAFGGD